MLREQGVQIAERTYRAWKRAQPSTRDLQDAEIIDAILTNRVDAGGGSSPESMYGRRKMTALLRRQGYEVSARKVDRLMGQLGIKGLVRGTGVRTTVPERNAARAPDLLDRDFTAPVPNQRWVADFTYVRTWAGFVYVSFVIDCYSRAIVGWHAATTMTTPLVTTALRMGLWRRDRAGHTVQDGLVHHSDAGSQGGFNRSSQHPRSHWRYGRWPARTGQGRSVTRPRVRVGSGEQIGLCGPPCALLEGRSPHERCNVSFGV